MKRLKNLQRAVAVYIKQPRVVIDDAGRAWCAYIAAYAALKFVAGLLYPADIDGELASSKEFRDRLAEEKLGVASQWFDNYGSTYGKFGNNDWGAHPPKLKLNESTEPETIENIRFVLRYS